MIPRTQKALLYTFGGLQSFFTIGGFELAVWMLFPRIIHYSGNNTTPLTSVTFFEEHWMLCNTHSRYPFL